MTQPKHQRTVVVHIQDRATGLQLFGSIRCERARGRITLNPTPAIVFPTEPGVVFAPEAVAEALARLSARQTRLGVLLWQRWFGVKT